MARSLSVVGDRWTILLLREAFLGVRRFDEEPYQERPERFEYRLTRKGRDLFPVITSLVTWGDRWNPSRAIVDRDET